MQDLRKTRIIILLVTTALISIGVVMIYSSSAVYAYEKFNDNFFFLKRHFISLALGAALAIFFMSVELHELRKHSKKLIMVSILLLVLVLIPGIGTVMGGARRWLRIGGVHFQPIELIKPFFLIYLADFLDRKSLKKNSLFNIYIPLMFVICVVCGLILLQPDLGGLVEFAIIGFMMLFVHGAKLKHLFITFALSIPLISFMILKSPYRLTRILTFIDPWKDPRRTGFQMIQSFIALGSGGIFGVGLGNSKQKLLYLPAAHTDFIFSIIGEELGFLGAALILSLFAVFVWKGMTVAFKENLEFSHMLAFGISLMIGLEVIVNISVAIGALPTKGLPLPFISYGGSSLVSHMVMAAMLLNAARED